VPDNSLPGSVLFCSGSLIYWFNAPTSSTRINRAQQTAAGNGVGTTFAARRHFLAWQLIYVRTRQENAGERIRRERKEPGEPGVKHGK